MVLYLAPEVEKGVRETAAREGVSIEELFRRTFAPAAAAPVSPKPVDEETPEETHARVMNLLAERQKQYGLPVPPGGFRTIAELFAQWEAEDANMTPEQVEEERLFWEEHQREVEKWPVHI